jgi:glycosyltransferase involved in cell wall biosynthesis
MPRVSVILPTYNRLAWLPDAFDALAAQAFTDFDLSIVDDGSTDDTPAAIARLAGHAPFPVACLRQPNAGPGAARQAGLAHALHARRDPPRYVAFYDSDDRWLPHHLHDAVLALDANPDVDWVFSSVRVVDHATARVLDPDVFRTPGRPRPLLEIEREQRGPLAVLTGHDAFAAAVAGDNLPGFQVSVCRRRLFDPHATDAAPGRQALRIPPLRIGEDLALTALAIHHGHTLAFLDDVHVEYRVHYDHASTVQADQGWARRRRNLRRYAAAMRYIRRRVDPTAHPERREAIDAALADLLFWRLGYHALPHDAPGGLSSMRLALSLTPRDWHRWKTYTAARLRSRRGPRPCITPHATPRRAA